MEKIDVVGIAIVLLLPITAIMTIVQRRLLHAVISRAVFGISASLVYMYLKAPDVAITEALMGAILVTLLYVIAIKSSGIVRVGFVPVYMLMEKVKDEMQGVEAEILKRFFTHHHLKYRLVEFENQRELIQALKDGFIDVACGGILASEAGKNLRITYLETKRLEVEDGRMLDLVRARYEVIMGKLHPSLLKIAENDFYVFVVSKENEYLHELLTNFIQEKQEEVRNIVKEHIGGMDK